MRRRRSPKNTPHSDPAPDYYKWSSAEISLADLKYTVATRAALGDFAAEKALSEIGVRVLGAIRGRVLHYGCGRGLLAAALHSASDDLQLTLGDDNVAAAEAAKLSAHQNGFTAEATCIELPPADSFDTVVLTMPRGRERVSQLLSAAVRSITKNGSLAVLGFNDEGIRSVIRMCSKYFGEPLSEVAMRHARGAIFSVGDSAVEIPAQRESVFEATIQGHEYSIATMPGVFAAGRLDEGTANLLDLIEVSPHSHCLDLGSGNGIIGAAMARKAAAGRAVLVDSSATAVRCSKRTLELNNIGNADVLLSDVGERLGENDFDLIASNPPFHRSHDVDYAVATEIIRCARRVARPNARFFLVANRFLPYERWMDQHWPGFRILSEGASYKVFCGVV